MYSIKIFYNSKFIRTVEFHIGESYIVKPLNPAKKKDRDRECKLLEYDPHGKRNGDCRVEWHDNKRESWISGSDLVLLSESKAK